MAAEINVWRTDYHSGTYTEQEGMSERDEDIWHFASLDELSFEEKNRAQQGSEEYETNGDQRICVIDLPQPESPITAPILKTIFIKNLSYPQISDRQFHDLQKYMFYRSQGRDLCTENPNNTDPFWQGPLQRLATTVDGHIDVDVEFIMILGGKDEGDQLAFKQRGKMHSRDLIWHQDAYCSPAYEIDRGSTLRAESRAFDIWQIGRNARGQQAKLSFRGVPRKYRVSYHDVTITRHENLVHPELRCKRVTNLFLTDDHQYDDGTYNPSPSNKSYTYYRVEWKDGFTRDSLASYSSKLQHKALGYAHHLSDGIWWFDPFLEDSPIKPHKLERVLSSIVIKLNDKHGSITAILHAPFTASKPTNAQPTLWWVVPKGRYFLQNTSMTLLCSDGDPYHPPLFSLTVDMQLDVYENTLSSNDGSVSPARMWFRIKTVGNSDTLYPAVFPYVHEATGSIENNIHVGRTIQPTPEHDSASGSHAQPDSGTVAVQSDSRGLIPEGSVSREGEETPTLFLLHHVIQGFVESKSTYTTEAFQPVLERRRRDMVWF